jgi:cytochrome c oxidase subunit IV
MNHELETEHEPVSYGIYVISWLALVVLTAITVSAAGMSFGSFSVFVALVIAAIKASVVLYFFMHLKYESKLFHTMLFIVVMTLAIFIALTFTDTLFR